jgi:uncharacterized cupredoxin-like copper-binding protein
MSLAVLAACLPLSRALAAAPDAMAGMAPGTGHHHAHSPATRFDFGAPARADQATRTVKIVIGDQTFDTDKIVVHPREIVRFIVTNSSTINHEFALADHAGQVAHRREMAEALGRGEVMGHDDPNVITVQPGQTKELAWAFAGAGTLEFDCNIPGHYESGMKGAIIVR